MACEDISQFDGHEKLVVASIFSSMFMPVEKEDVFR